MRQIALWLRHQPPAELQMDEAGWVTFDRLAKLLKTTPEALKAHVGADNKQRFTVVGDRIRAAQGHSTSVVSPQALEASWTPFCASEVYHGTNTLALDGIKRDGFIVPGARTHVHCAVSPDSSVGKRTNVPVLLKIDSTGLPMWLSENGVVLSGPIPWSRVTEVRHIT